MRLRERPFKGGQRGRGLTDNQGERGDGMLRVRATLLGALAAVPV